MALMDLPEADREVVWQCLRAIVQGEFIADVEFHARLGLSRAQIRALLASWPRINDRDDDSDACLALNNSMNEVCHGAAIKPREWQTWFTVPNDEVKAVFERWARSRGWSVNGVR